MWFFGKKKQSEGKDPTPEDHETGVGSGSETRVPNLEEILESVKRAWTHAEAGESDLATDVARRALRSLRDGGYLENLPANPACQEAAGKAFLCLAEAYKGVGALACAQRILQIAARYELREEESARISDELARLDAALKDFSVLDRNADWEAFLSTSLEGERFAQLCKDEGYPLLGRRVELLIDKFRDDATYNATDEEEMWLIDEENRLR